MAPEAHAEASGTKKASLPRFGHHGPSGPPPRSRRVGANRGFQRAVAVTNVALHRQPLNLDRRMKNELECFLSFIAKKAFCSAARLEEVVECAAHVSGRCIRSCSFDGRSCLFVGRGGPDHGEIIVSTAVAVNGANPEPTMRTCVRDFAGIASHPLQPRDRTPQPPQRELAAREMDRVSLEQALQLVALYCEQDDPRADRAMVRWLSRLFAEKPLSFSLAAQCVELVGELRGPDAERGGPGVGGARRRLTVCCSLVLRP